MRCRNPFGDDITDLVMVGALGVGAYFLWQWWQNKKTAQIVTETGPQASQYSALSTAPNLSLDGPTDLASVSSGSFSSDLASGYQEFLNQNPGGP